MANPIFHSQYTAAQIEDLIENGAPIIQNGYWWRWDVATQQYVNTNITADSETAAEAAEAAQAAAELAQGKAEDAQDAAETAQGLAEDARDAAAASAASIAASAAQIDANTKRINYVALREEEDRQILFGSVVEAAEDTYDELRAAPIHNAITIGGSVYPRMDRTRMAIDRMLGRTVAFNQLVKVPASSRTKTENGVTFTDNRDGTVSVVTASGGATADTIFSFSDLVTIQTGHVYLLIGCPSGGSSSTYSWYLNNNIVDTGNGVIYDRGTYGTNAWYPIISVKAGTVISTAIVFRMQVFDLTQQYGTTTAAAIAAMTQSAGVAYVRQRMDSDYYAANAGELVAPVVSGVSFVGFNVWDEVRERGYYDLTTGAKVEGTSRIRCANYIPVLPNTAYYTNAVLYHLFYDADHNFISSDDRGNYLFTTPANAAYMTIYNDANTMSANICINYSKTTGTPKNGDYLPYLSTTLSLPSTRLDGVGTAQDMMYVREDGENDYSIVKRSMMGLADMGDLNWIYDSTRFWVSISDMADVSQDFICSNYVRATTYADTNKTIYAGNFHASREINVMDTDYTTAAAFKAAVTGQKLAYRLKAPTETVLASHLTLAQISAIAENGGIISVVNSNGHIVQPDMVCDVVISRSAS